jgi:hypothetical protein
MAAFASTGILLHELLAQVASDVTTAAKPLVLPEVESQIAEFLYHFMKQLQPCRFTEADSDVNHKSVFLNK